MLKLLYREYFWQVTIEWSKPVNYSNINFYELANDSNFDLYMITGKYSDYKHKIFYIGKSYFQTISKRLNQKDHIQRIQSLKKKHPKHDLFISCGKVNIADSRKTQKRIDEIESILIFSFDTDAKINKNKNYTLNTKSNHYIITNKGYRAELEKKLYFGLFYDN